MSAAANRVLRAVAWHVLGMPSVAHHALPPGPRPGACGGLNAGLRPGARLGFRLGFRLGAAMLVLLAAGTVGAQPVSPAEILLFETDHLAKMKSPATLVYEFRKLSNVEPAFTDSVQLDVSRDKGQVHAVMHFLTGERKRALPDVDDAHGNPVLLGFLERDIAEMKRLTGGSIPYFRKRIRMALAETAQVTPQRITYQGKTVDGKVVRIQPYLNDPMHARFEKYVRKTYVFLLSEAVPGGVYQVRTTLANDGQAPAGTVVARTAAPGGQGRAPSPENVAKRGGALPGGTVPDTAKAAAAAPGTAQPGAAASGSAMPVIDETLTLVKVTEARR